MGLEQKDYETIRYKEELTRIKHRIKIYKRRTKEEQEADTKILQQLQHTVQLESQEMISGVLDELRTQVIESNKAKRENLVDLKISEFIEKLEYPAQSICYYCLPR